MSTNIELNQLGTAGLALGASVGTNVLVTPLATVKTCAMGGKEIVLSQLYKGFVPLCLADAPGMLIAYGANEALKSKIGGLPAAIVAGVLAAPGEAAAEAWMVNAQARAKLTTRELLSCALRPAGMAATAMRSVPYTTGLFYGAPALEKGVMALIPKEQHSPGVDLAVQTVTGAAAGGIAGLFSTPPDVVKTHIQLSKTPLSCLAAARSIKAQHGWKGFMLGAVPRVGYLSSSLAAMHLINNIMPHYLPGSMKKDNRPA